MTHLDLDSATLFRLLTAFFGKDQILYGMSLYTICGGSLPEGILEDQVMILKALNCFFTVVDEADHPKLVIDLLPYTGGVIEMGRFEQQELVEQALLRVGVKYVTISEDELRELQDPLSGLDLCTLLMAKVGSD